ncbi:ZIP family metal transporter [Bacillus solimangrovi]|nr:ZIP family metal transporter [Bacillus solimangrovi]
MGIYITLPLLIGSLIGSWTLSLFGHKQNVLNRILGIGMLLVIVIEYIPHILGEYDISGIVIGSVTAITVFIVIERYFTSTDKGNHYRFSTLAIIVSFIAHSIPMGVSLGMISMNDMELAISQFRGMLFHHLAEGIAIIGILMNEQRATWGKLFACVIAISLFFYLSILIGMVYEVNVHTENWVVGISLGSLLYAVHHLLEKNN